MVRRWQLAANGMNVDFTTGGRFSGGEDGRTFNYLDSLPLHPEGIFHF